MEEIIQKEIEKCLRTDYSLGSYLYLGMAKKNGEKVCIAVAYKINYCIKKIDTFLALDPELELKHISKIKVGELKACQKFNLTEPLKKYYQ